MIRLLLHVFITLLVSPAFCDQPACKQLVIVQSPLIDENSGIDLSYKYPNAAWTHNDSGGNPYLYLISLITGNTLATIKLENTINNDWEDISTFRRHEKSFIVVGDFGDNQKNRKECQICILEEPEIVPGDPVIRVINHWTDFRFKYEDGPRNCEAMGINLIDNQIILLEKIYHNVKGTPGVYALPLPEKSTPEGLALRVSELSVKNISALDISDDGQSLIVRAYHAGYVFRRSAGQTWPEIFARGTQQSFEFPMQLQGEGVCFSKENESVLISSEKVKQPIFEVTLPKTAP